MIPLRAWHPANPHRSLWRVMPRPWLMAGLIGGLALAACGKGSSGWVLSEDAVGDGGAGGQSNQNEAGAAGEGGAVSLGGAGVGEAGQGAAGEAQVLPPGARCPTRFAAVCSPTVVVDNKDQVGSGKLFSAAIEDPSTTLSCITRDTCDILYRKATEIRNVTKITVIIEDFAGVSETYASAPGEATIHMSSRHLQQVADAHGDVGTEVRGIFYYHATNIYQFDDGNGAANSWLVQGVADYVRHVAGYLSDSQRHAGGAYNDGGDTTGFFLVWLDQKYPDFVYELNASLNPSDSVTWTTQSFADITGQSVDLLWANYQATL